ncbi:hypothetical protein [Paenibacillus ottowii]
MDCWQDQLNGDVFDSSNRNVPNPRGAPKGNKNAVGNRVGVPPGNHNAKGNSGGPGGPYRNKKALKHGIYETIFLDMLNEQEQALFDAIEVDTFDQLRTTLKTLVVSERRTMRRIKKLEAGLTDEEKKIKRENVPGYGDNHRVAFKLDKILKSEDHVNKVHEQMYSLRLAFFYPYRS